jgi:C4-dicarboxylate transporter DctM subunit
MLANAMGELSSVEYLLILNIILLIAGCFFEPGSAIIILAPVLVPIGVMLGLNPWHIGIVFTVNLAIGMFTPPFGFNLFVMQSIFKIPLEKVARACVPYIVLYLIALVFITYIPQLSLWLPMRAGY